MNRYLYAIVYAILVLSIVDPLNAKRFGGGGGRHSYPKSGGLSGSGGSHSYPHSGGLSGGGHGSSSGSHGYPASSGMSGSHGSPNTGGSHGYPSSGSNSHGYPPGKGLSGNSPSSQAGHTTHVHNYYNYNPPQQIRYTPVHGAAPVSYPVYRGAPPTYVYQYKDSGSKYGTLLAGLALLNLGTLAGGAYALSHAGQSSHSYKPQPGEVCKFGVKKDNGDYEETKIDCQLITSFIFEEQAKAQNNGGTNTTVVTTITNVTTINTGNGAPETSTGLNKMYEMFPNGTLVPADTSTANATLTNATNTSANNVTSSVTITTTNTTVTNALDVKGKPVEVTPGMKCYVMRHSPTSNMRRSVPCGLLQSYADQSLNKNSASKTVPFLTTLTVILGMLVTH
ncbi:uncharacterized protein LOC126967561 [Leptidea sinapis]|uniref:uncharacterized protein LOC126967561 n=1 Tax=Leptidea sinapis TaxID=189913 RepID=UPI0021C47A86|nr:uncharacterized protein LOC126967561 [Leptidea sinapis]